MKTAIYFENANSAIEEIFRSEFPDISQEDFSRILSLLYISTRYEEEDLRIKPTIYFTDSIELIAKLIPSINRITIFHDDTLENLRKRMKSILCFCANNWSVYVNISNKGIEYGLFKSFSSIKDRSLKNFIFDDELLKEKVSLIRTNVVGGGQLILDSIKGETLDISFNFLNTANAGGFEDAVKLFSEAAIDQFKTKSLKKKTELANIYQNIFSGIFKNSHGTICLVVDESFYLDKKLLKDGVWLESPIEFAKIFTTNQKDFSEYKLNSYTDLIKTMTEYDGITVFDNSGKILAYNVFVESKLDSDDTIIGGARLRAANTLLNSPDKGIIGVYFQSANGNNFYKETETRRKKKGSTIVIMNDEKPSQKINEETE